jgi:NADH-quinone oxidoreductase subunit N
MSTKGAAAVTAFISSASKAAGFAFLLRLGAEALMPAMPQLMPALAAIAAITMTLGNLVALRQSNLKRLLAYSSVGQVGYLILGVAVLSSFTASGVIFHLTGYVLNNLAVFCCLIVAYHHTRMRIWKRWPASRGALLSSP